MARLQVLLNLLETAPWRTGRAWPRSSAGRVWPRGARRRTGRAWPRGALRRHAGAATGGRGRRLVGQRGRGRRLEPRLRMLRPMLLMMRVMRIGGDHKDGDNMVVIMVMTKTMDHRPSGWLSGVLGSKTPWRQYKIEINTIK